MTLEEARAAVEEADAALDAARDRYAAADRASEASAGDPALDAEWEEALAGLREAEDRSGATWAAYVAIADPA